LENYYRKEFLNQFSISFFFSYGEEDKIKCITIKMIKMQKSLYSLPVIKPTISIYCTLYKTLFRIHFNDWRSMQQRVSCIDHM